MQLTRAARAIALVSALLVGTAFAGPARATLIGDDAVTLQLDVIADALSPTLVLSQTIELGPVGSGLEASFFFQEQLFPGILIEVDIGAEDITVRAANQTGGGRGPIHVTATFTGLDWMGPGGEPGIITGIDLTSDFDQTVSTAIVDAGHGIEVMLFDEGFRTTDDVYSTASLTFTIVPEPATLGLLGAGLVALVGAARRS